MKVCNSPKAMTFGLLMKKLHSEHGLLDIDISGIYLQRCFWTDSIENQINGIAQAPNWDILFGFGFCPFQSIIIYRPPIGTCFAVVEGMPHQARGWYDCYTKWQVQKQHLEPPIEPLAYTCPFLRRCFAKKARGWNQFRAQHLLFFGQMWQSTAAISIVVPLMFADELSKCRCVIK